jgi:hypothetical protein
MNRQQSLSIFVAAVSFLTISGCTGPHYLTLQYPPDEMSACAPRSDSGVTIADSIQLAIFTDQRDERDRVGNTQNAYGVELNNIFANNDVVEWAQKGIVSELKTRGITAVPFKQSKPSTHPVLQGSLQKVYCTAYWVYEGEVRFSAKLTGRDSSVLLDKKYSGYGNAGVNMAARDEEFGRTLGIALQDASRLLADDIIKTLHPSAAAPQTQATTAASTQAVAGTAPATENLSARSTDSLCALNKKCVVISGSRSFESVKTALGRLDSIARKKQDDRLQLNPDVQGDLCLLLTIGENGTITDIRSAASSLKDDLLERQIIEEIQTFPKLKVPKASAPTALLYRIKLERIDIRSRKAATGVIIAILGCIPLAISLITLNASSF